MSLIDTTPSCPERHAPLLSASPVTTEAVAARTSGATRGEFTVQLELRHAGRRTVTLRYEILGAAHLPVVVVAGGISADRHVSCNSNHAEPGWWDAQVGAGRAIDPARHCVLGFDWLGADGCLDVAIDPADQADALAALLDALDLARIEAFVGCSYGAMVGLQFAARHGGRLGQLVSISGSHRAHPYASAWRALQRRAVALGALQCDETHGLELARQLAILSYRTPAEFAARFGAAEVRDGRVRVAAEDYLDHCAGKYVAKTSPTAFLRLSESIDLQTLDPAQVQVPVTVVAVEEDRLIPVADAYDLVERLGRAPGAQEPRLRVLRSPYGHDAFLKEDADIAAVINDALAGAVAVAA
ncbi:homoserine O-succinyltransferase MetX [Lysobacter sp. D1-1-M9]|uniref:homoserine O-succinyltransferase MetX n=1 Tax=Novilysobacter longmucuonensis TaxID=3098603 RepID=UPI002FC5D13C